MAELKGPRQATSYRENEAGRQQLGELGFFELWIRQIRLRGETGESNVLAVSILAGSDRGNLPSTYPSLFSSLT